MLKTHFESDGGSHMMDTTSYELVDSEAFFAPVPWTPIDDLLTSYQTQRVQVEQVATLFAGDIVHCIGYFFEGNSSARERGLSHSVAKKANFAQRPEM